MSAVKRILIVDDEADIREVAKLSLELDCNWEVLTAGSGQEGLSMAIQQQPDAILLDMMMPEMDGTATWEALQNHPETQKIPVILLTAKTQPKEQKRYAELGVSAVLSKPFDPITLATHIAKALNWEH